MNEKILAADNKVMKRIYSVDTLTYQEGALSTKTKEMLGLVSSMVLRCDDCVKYHLEKCFEQGVTTEEIFEVFSVCQRSRRNHCNPAIPVGLSSTGKNYKKK
jgi:AhpD family alkylhydroperoxidase